MRKLLLILIAVLSLVGCSRQQPHYIIGVSQCSADIWREKQNAELRMETYLHDNLELRFAAAYDSDERQVQQIDSLVATGIDLLIVAPNQVQTISPAIDRAYDQGIPIIVFERKTNSKKYSVFISADNYEMGHVMGDFIATQLQGRGRVMEVMGLSGSSPAIERHKGFVDAISQHPGIELVATLQGDWTEQSAYDAVQAYDGDLSNIDFVFGQNDRMAIGARKALSTLHPSPSTNHESPSTLHESPSTLHESPSTLHESPSTIRYCGIDGLPGKGGGIQLVLDSLLDATYIYPTHGDQLIDVALDMLNGKPHQKEIMLKSALVTRDNANVLLMQGEEIMRQTVWLDQLHEKADGYLRELDTQRTITLLAIGIIALLLLAIVLFYRYHLGKITLQRERVVNTLWNLKPEDVSPLAEAQQAGQADQQPQQVKAEERAEQEEEVKTDPATTSIFITRFKEAVEARLADSDISVEDLAMDMNISRVQLYRKVKSITGSSPVELLRTARLNRGYQLLLTTDLTVSEVAYQVGFTAPSYFTKCFKEEYGQLPGDIRQHL